VRNMHKRGTSIMLVMLMVLGGLNRLFNGGDKAYASVVEPEFAGGTGAIDDPYQIANHTQLMFSSILSSWKRFAFRNQWELPTRTVVLPKLIFVRSAICCQANYILHFAILKGVYED
jgi:hypothetical protein